MDEKCASTTEQHHGSIIMKKRREFEREKKHNTSKSFYCWFLLTHAMAAGRCEKRRYHFRQIKYYPQAIGTLYGIHRRFYESYSTHSRQKKSERNE